MENITPNEQLTDTPDEVTTPTEETPAVSAVPAKTRRANGLPPFKSDEELRCDLNDCTVVQALRDALKAHCDRLIIEVTLPQRYPDGSQTVLTTRFTAKMPQYATYRVIETYLGGFWEVQDVATKEEALAVIAERRGQLERGRKLQVIGVRADGGIDGHELLQGLGVGRS